MGTRLARRNPRLCRHLRKRKEKRNSYGPLYWWFVPHRRQRGRLGLSVFRCSSRSHLAASSRQSAQSPHTQNRERPHSDWLRLRLLILAFSNVGGNRLF